MRINENTIRLYYKTLRFRRGLSIELFLTFRCNEDCSYCNLKLATGKIQSKESTLDQWKEFIINFPVKLKEVRLCGGEALLYKDIIPFIHWLLDRGLHVKVLTNLTDVTELMKIRRSYRFTVSATYHHHIHPKIFLSNYSYVRKRHRITVSEIGSRKLGFSHLNALQRTIDETQPDEFRVAPDRTMFVGDKSMIIAKSIKI